MYFAFIHLRGRIEDDGRQAYYAILHLHTEALSSIDVRHRSGKYGVLTQIVVLVYLRPELWHK